MRPWQAIILIILLAFFAISSGWHVLYILTYVLLGLLVLSWLWARSVHGGYVMRVEDIDRPRVRPDMARRQLEELRWLGLDWDGEPIFQSDRSPLYEDALRQLGPNVYECVEFAAQARLRRGRESGRGSSNEASLGLPAFVGSRRSFVTCITLQTP